MNLEQPGRIGGRLVALGDHLSNLGLLLRRELWAASADATFLAGGIQSGLGPLFEHGPLELGECPDHLHHHSSCRCSRVDGFGQTAEGGADQQQYNVASNGREYPLKLPRIMHEYVVLWQKRRTVSVTRPRNDLAPWPVARCPDRQSLTGQPGCMVIQVTRPFEAKSHHTLRVSPIWRARIAMAWR